MRNTSKLVLFLILLSITSSCSRNTTSTPDVPIPMTFNGASEELKATEVVATLDTPISKGKNVIWCASFQSAWKALEGLASEPVTLDGFLQIAESLNNAADPRPQIPEACLYVAAGWNQEGITNQIEKDLKQRFPDKETPTFPGIMPDSFVAYSYLEANVKFPLPYFQNDQPLTFTDGEGKKLDVNSFGIRPKDNYSYYKLRAQGRVLFRKDEGRNNNLEFAIDLCSDSSPSQIVVARISPEPSLADALARIQKESMALETLRRGDSRRVEHLQEIGPNDVLIVPDLFWLIRHHFSQVEGRAFNNTKLKGQRLDVAQQDTLFRLDRSGAELKSESKVYYEPVPTHFVLDRPFLIYMKKRGAEMPYFAMWVDNAELLRPWQGSSQSSPPGYRDGTNN